MRRTHHADWPQSGLGGLQFGSDFWTSYGHAPQTLESNGQALLVTVAAHSLSFMPVTLARAAFWIIQRS
jgi:hypothetical protein